MPVLVFLVLLWAAVLVPVAAKVVGSRRAYFASSFGDGLQALEQAEGFVGTDPELHARAVYALEPTPGVDGAESSGPLGTINAALLRSILGGLLIATVISLAAAVVTSQRAMLAVHVALDDCLLAFVGLLVLRRDASIRRRSPQPVPERDVVSFDGAPLLRPPHRVYNAGVPVIAAPVVGAMSGG
ncbi:MAG TPA: hypothetical protein VM121_09435 [Acidimicrobiales bacterium]|nr:hypothetical protein [Acidimicrobiales bacterium]